MTGCMRTSLVLLISLQAEQSDFPFASIAELCDQVIVMAFDQHWQRAPPDRWRAPTGLHKSWRSVGRRFRRRSCCGELETTVTTRAGQETASKTFDEVMLTARENKATSSSTKSP